MISLEIRPRNFPGGRKWRPGRRSVSGSCALTCVLLAFSGSSAGARRRSQRSNSRCSEVARGRRSRRREGCRGAVARELRPQHLGSVIGTFCRRACGCVSGGAAPGGALRAPDIILRPFGYRLTPSSPPPPPGAAEPSRTLARRTVGRGTIARGTVARGTAGNGASGKRRRCVHCDRRQGLQYSHCRRREGTCSLHLVPSGGRQHAKRRRRGGSQNAEMAPIAAQRLGKLCANVCFVCFSGVVSRGSKTESAEQLALLRSRPGQPVATAAGLPRRGRAGASVNALGECHTHFLRRRLRLRFRPEPPRGALRAPRRVEYTQSAAKRCYGLAPRRQVARHSSTCADQTPQSAAPLCTCVYLCGHRPIGGDNVHKRTQRYTTVHKDTRSGRGGHAAPKSPGADGRDGAGAAPARSRASFGTSTWGVGTALFAEAPAAAFSAGAPPGGPAGPPAR